MTVARSIGVAALVLAGAALADVPPIPPEHPIPEACNAIKGLWRRNEPGRTYFDEIWTILAIGSENAVILTYTNSANGVLIQAKSATYGLSCKLEKNGMLTVDFLAQSKGQIGRSMTGTLKADIFKTQETNMFNYYGPPEATYNPTPIDVTYTRIAL